MNTERQSPKPERGRPGRSGNIGAGALAICYALVGA